MSLPTALRRFRDTAPALDIAAILAGAAVRNGNRADAERKITRLLTLADEITAAAAEVRAMLAQAQEHAA